MLATSTSTGQTAPETAGTKTSPQLRAGAATSNITPRLGTSINGYFTDRKARNVHDELHARCLVLESGLDRLAIAICDSCMIPDKVMRAAKQSIFEQTGLRPEQVLIAATHTHTAPTSVSLFQSDADTGYQKFLAERISDGVVRAIRNLAPARIGWGKGSVPDEVFNRRWKLKPGTMPPNPFGGTNDLVKMNPTIGSPDLVEPAGPTDPEVSVLAVQTLSGRPIALLANYSLHYVGTSADEEISADYYGAFGEKMKQLLGTQDNDPPFVAILSNGTSGDINNINFREPRPPGKPYDRIHTVAGKVAAEATRVYRALEFRETVRLRAAATTLPLGVRKPDAHEVKQAKALVTATPVLKTPQEVYARETVLMEGYPPKVELTLQALGVGDLAIAAIPCEVFAEIGLELKRKSPFGQTFTIELANGYHGYLPTPAQHQLGGYETWRARSSYLETAASDKIASEVLRLFAKIRE